MFFLTSGILKKINKRNKIQDGAIPLPESSQCVEFYKMNTLFIYKPIVLKIIDIIFFAEEDVFAVKLYDSTSINSRAFLDKTLWSLIDPKLNPNNNSECFEKTLYIGSIIILKEYCYENIIIRNYQRDNGTGNNIIEEMIEYLEDCLKIIDLILVGFEEILK